MAFLAIIFQSFECNTLILDKLFNKYLLYFTISTSL